MTVRRLIVAVIATGVVLLLPVRALATTCPTFTFDPAGTTVRPGTDLPVGTVAKAYGPLTIKVSGGSPPYHWSIDLGLPPGLQWGVTSSAGTSDNDQLVISGIPNNTGNGAGPYDIGFVVFDQNQGVCGGQERFWHITTGFAPTNTSPPTISGTPAVGATLTCNDGAWTEDPNFPSTPSYGWFLDGQGAAIATGKQYIVGKQVAGHTLTCHVTHTNPFGSATGVSGPVNVPCPGTTVGGKCAVLSVTQALTPTAPGLGEHVVVSVFVTNLGTAAAADVVLRDQLPANAEFVRQQSSAECSGAQTGILECHIGSLAAGTFFHIRLEIIAPNVDATVVNDAEAAATNADPADSQVSFSVSPPKLRIAHVGFKARGSGSPAVRTDHPAFAPGQPLTVQVAIVNDGGSLPVGRIHIDGENPRSDHFAAWDPGKTNVVYISLTARERPYRLIVSDPRHVFLTYEFSVPIDRPLQPTEVVNSALGLYGGVVPSSLDVEAPALPPAEVLVATQQRPTLQVQASDHMTCRWLASTSVRFKTTSVTNGRCAHPIWLRARGRRHWSLHLRHRLPRGRYTFYVRVIDKRGAFDPVFSRKHHNVFTLTVR